VIVEVSSLLARSSGTGLRALTAAPAAAGLSAGVALTFLTAMLVKV
jgi:hypothetical protein